MIEPFDPLSCTKRIECVRAGDGTLPPGCRSGLGAAQDRVRLGEQAASVQRDKLAGNSCFRDK